jgi:hypothetical protein
MTKILAATLAIGLMATVSMAQTKVVAEIPFEFYVGDTKLPAGAYEIKVTSPTTIRVMSASGSDSVSTLVMSQIRRTSTIGQSKLVFTVYGSDYFLSEVWREGGETGRALAKARREMELARQGFPARIVAR